MTVTLKEWRLVFILFLVGFGLYFSDIKNPFVWDDDNFVINNKVVHDINVNNLINLFTHSSTHFAGGESDYYRPISFLTYAFNYKLSGQNPVTYHLFNNFFHAVNGVFIFLVVRKFEKKELYAFLVALTFLIHPINVQTVAYISGRDTPLSTMFVLLSLFLFNKKYLLSLILFVLALFSRETVVFFPAVLFLYTLLSKESSSIGLVKKTVPFFILSLCYILLRIFVLNFNDTLNAPGEAYSESFWIRVLTYLGLIPRYLALILAPLNLHFSFRNIGYDSFFSPFVLLGLIILIGVVLCLIRGCVEKRGDRYVWALGLGWFFISQVVTSGTIVPLHFTFQEHWMYFPMIGFWIIGVYYLAKLLATKHKKLISVVLLVYFTYLVAYTLERIRIWGDYVAIHEEVLRYEPGRPKTLSSLGHYYFSQGDENKALYYYLEAVKNGASFPEAYYNVGSLMHGRGEFDKAEDMYKLTIQVDEKYVPAYKSLAGMYGERGRWMDAISVFKQLEQFTADDSAIAYNIAFAYSALKDQVNAKKYLLKAKELASGSVEWQERIRKLDYDLSNLK